jgi:hypothetical protein
LNVLVASHSPATLIRKETHRAEGKRFVASWRRHRAACSDAVLCARRGAHGQALEPSQTTIVKLRRRVCRTIR